MRGGETGAMVRRVSQRYHAVSPGGNPSARSRNSWRADLSTQVVKDRRQALPCGLPHTLGDRRSIYRVEQLRERRAGLDRQSGLYLRDPGEAMEPESADGFSGIFEGWTVGGEEDVGPSPLQRVEAGEIVRHAPRVLGDPGRVAAAQNKIARKDGPGLRPVEGVVVPRVTRRQERDQRSGIGEHLLSWRKRASPGTEASDLGGQEVPEPCRDSSVVRMPVGDEDHDRVRPLYGLPQPLDVGDLVRSRIHHGYGAGSDDVGPGPIESEGAGVVRDDDPWARREWGRLHPFGQLARSARSWSASRAATSWRASESSSVNAATSVLSISIWPKI
jgi:hypothetical protein